MKTIGYRILTIVVLCHFLFGVDVFAGPGNPNNNPRVNSGLAPPIPGEFDSFDDGPRMYPRPPGPPQGIRLEHILRNLDLTEEQADQIKDILEAKKEDIEAAKRAIAEAKKVLDEALLEDVNEVAIRAAAATFGSTIGDEAVMKATTMASIREVLTEEQLTEIDELRINHNRYRRGFREDMRGPRRGPRRPQIFFGPGRPEEGPPGHGPNRERPPHRGLNIERLFENWDSDQDGALTWEELEAFKESMDNRPHRSR